MAQKLFLIKCNLMKIVIYLDFNNKKKVNNKLIKVKTLIS